MPKQRAASKRSHAAPQRGAKSSGASTQKAAPAAAKPSLKRAYVSDGDDSDDDDGPASGPIPLASLEQGSVRDFIAEFEREHDASVSNAAGTKKKKAQHVSKRARAELEQLAIDKAKKKQREDRAEKVVWRKFDRENRVFEQYYRRALQLSDDEWAQFVTALKTPMAVQARVNSHYKTLAEIVQGTLELDFPVQDVTVRLPSGEDQQVEFAAAPWSDDKLTWRMNLDIKSFRKAEALRDLHTYIQTQSHLGTIQRVDPLTILVSRFLGAQRGDRVLDLCGGGEQRAPLIAEMLQREISDEDPAASSVLVVNERDAAMAARAVQSLSRTLALSRELVVTAHKPIDFPQATSDDDSALFDRVLCSAPCSGDGLVRKIPEKWRTWSPEQGHKFHGTQVALAAKAMSLVRVGGSLLYTTRSLNPIENEAVVAELLRNGDGAFELVDLSDTCPSVQRKPGLASWDVVDVDMNTGVDVGDRDAGAAQAAACVDVASDRRRTGDKHAPRALRATAAAPERHERTVCRAHPQGASTASGSGGPSTAAAKRATGRVEGGEEAPQSTEEDPRQLCQDRGQGAATSAQLLRHQLARAYAGPRARTKRVRQGLGVARRVVGRVRAHRRRVPGTTCRAPCWRGRVQAHRGDRRV
ncbi:hypothetical protein PINS_up002127 [Pythium insidiosum]|nr:hypothetical protein PINS_up002127 [Pythium insidiosum]